MSGLLERLGLLTDAAEPEHRTQLLRLCDAGKLRGGLSVALDVRPDELIGPLTHALGGPATRLKVLDVRGEAPTTLLVEANGAEESWELDDLPGLVMRLNDLYATTSEVKLCAVLGEWDEMLHLWCLPRPAVRALLKAPFFAPENQAQLEALTLPR